MSVLRKGFRKSIKERNVKAKKHIENFNRLLFEMNKVYHMLKVDDTLTKDNIEEKIKETSDIELTEVYIDMLKEDLLK